jgi:hypothetical protein
MASDIGIIIGQGCKVCSFSDMDLVREPHCRASRLDLQSRLDIAWKAEHLHSSPTRDIFHKTFALWSALHKQGCGGEPNEPTLYSEAETLQRQIWERQIENGRRGHEPKPTCNGRLIFQYDSRGHAFVR